MEDGSSRKMFGQGEGTEMGESNREGERKGEGYYENDI